MDPTRHGEWTRSTGEEPAAALYTILVAGWDDEKLDQLGRALRASGHRVLLPDDGDAASRQLDTGHVDAIICGTRTRLSSGVGLMCAAREARPGVLLILFVTGEDLHLAVSWLEDQLIHCFLLREWHTSYCTRAVTLALHRLRPRRSGLPGGARNETRSALLPTRAAAGPTRILVVEDDPDLRDRLGTMLGRHGFAVTLAETAQDAVRRAVEELPQIAIVALGLPHDDGVRVVDYLKSRHVDSVQVLGLAAYSAPEATTAALECGADDVIGKPISELRLLARIDSFERASQLTREMLRTAERAARLYVFASEATALLAHDVKNGLAVAASNLESLRDVVAQSPDAREAHEDTVCSLLRVSALVKNFCDLHRFHQGVVICRPESTDFHQLIEATIGLYRHAAGKRRVRIHVEHVSDEPLASMDRVLVERVLHNLICNALRYAPHGGEIAITTDLGANEDGQLFTLSIGNTGPPVSPAALSSLFEPHAAAASSTGIGLYFCRLACEAHGGSISLVPHSLYGALFRVEIPQRPGPGGSAPVDSC